MKVLSLFDGMACGMLAMQAAGIPVDRYVAYEYDEETANSKKGRPYGFAALTASHNFPMIEQRGDVFKGDYTEFLGFDWLIGGSPCTFWSIAQKNNRETKASGIGWELFCQYVRALNEAKPRFFIYENNKSMSDAIRKSITETFGFEPVLINSALVSAQNRQRLYWVGRRNADGTYSKVDVKQPVDRGILLKDVLDGNTDRDKARAVIGSIGRTTTREYFIKSQGTMAFEPVIFQTPRGKNAGGAKYNKSPTLTANGAWTENNKMLEPVCPLCSGKSRCVTAGYANKGAAHILESNFSENPHKQQWDSVAEPCCVAQRGRYADSGNRSRKGKGTIEQFYEAREDGKTNALTTVQKDNAVAEPVRIGTYPNNAKNQEKHDSQQYRIYSQDGKSVTPCGKGGGVGAKTGLYAIPVEFDGDIPTRAISGSDGKVYPVYEVKDGKIDIKGKLYPIKLADGYYIIRKLTVTECMRLQTVPPWYTFPVSPSQAYKMLGNGWTVDVITHLIFSVAMDDFTKGPHDSVAA